MYDLFEFHKYFKKEKTFNFMQPAKSTVLGKSWYIQFESCILKFEEFGGHVGYIVREHFL